MMTNRMMVFVALMLMSGLLHAECGAFQSSTPDRQLQDNADFTVTDLATGLMWQQCSLGQEATAECTGSATTYNWQGALQAADALNAQGGLAGHADWRLPNVKELRSLVDESCIEPAINETRFPNTPPAQYWTSTPYAYCVNCSWLVSFERGTAEHLERVLLMAVRLVRTAD